MQSRRIMRRQFNPQDRKTNESVFALGFLICSRKMLEFKISLVRPITPQTGLVKAEGKVISCGRRVGTAAIEQRLDTQWLSTKVREKRFDAQIRSPYRSDSRELQRGR